MRDRAAGIVILAGRCKKLGCYYREQPDVPAEWTHE